MKAVFNIDLTKMSGGIDTVEELERLQLELQVYTDNIAFLLTNSTSAEVVESAAVSAYQEKQLVTKSLYEKQKQSLVERYIPEYIQDGCDYCWSLNFKTGIITVTVCGESGISLLKDHDVTFTISD